MNLYGLKYIGACLKYAPQLNFICRADMYMKPKTPSNIYQKSQNYPSGAGEAFRFAWHSQAVVFGQTDSSRPEGPSWGELKGNRNL